MQLEVGIPRDERKPVWSYHSFSVSAPCIEMYQPQCFSFHFFFHFNPSLFLALSSPFWNKMADSALPELWACLPIKCYPGCCSILCVSFFLLEACYLIPFPPHLAQFFFFFFFYSKELMYHIAETTIHKNEALALLSTLSRQSKIVRSLVSEHLLDSNWRWRLGALHALPRVREGE